MSYFVETLLLGFFLFFNFFRKLRSLSEKKFYFYKRKQLFCLLHQSVKIQKKGKKWPSLPTYVMCKMHKNVQCLFWFGLYFGQKTKENFSLFINRERKNGQMCNADMHTVKMWRKGKDLIGRPTDYLSLRGLLEYKVSNGHLGPALGI